MQVRHDSPEIAKIHQAMHDEVDRACVIPTVKNARYVSDYKVYIEFDNGVKGVVNLKDRVGRKGIFKPLADVDFFRKLHVNEELGTICWENGADIAPEFLYERVCKQH